MSVQSDFVNKYKPYADTAAQGIGGGVTGADVLGQWAEETGWGQFINGQNNLGGIKPNNKLANYTTLDEFVTHYVYVMKQDLGAGSTFLDKLANGVYEGYNNLTENTAYAGRVGERIVSLKDSLPAIEPAHPDAPGDVMTHIPDSQWYDGIVKWMKDQAAKHPPGDTLIFTDPKTNISTMPDGSTTPTPTGTGVGGGGGFLGLGNVADSINKFGLLLGGIATGILLVVMGVWLIVKADNKEVQENVH